MPFTKDDPKPGPGRPKGAENKITREVKEMVLEAFGKLGGVDFLVTHAPDNIPAFFSLLGRAMPKEQKVMIMKRVTIDMIGLDPPPKDITPKPEALEQSS